MHKRQPPISFTVTVDTNALFPKYVIDIVSPKFMALWQECSGLAKLSLVVPEIVRGERLYQLVTAAEKATENAAKNFATICKVSGRAPPNLPTRRELRREVEKQFEKWRVEAGATIAPVPYGTIDWKRVVNDSIWRVKPFEAAGEDKDSEKGFRDCLILETLREIFPARNEQKLVFISNDTLLREAAIEQIHAKEFSAYEGLGNFASYLRLAHEEMNQEFVEALLQKVPSVFYTSDNPKCVYYTFKISQLVASKFNCMLDSLFDDSQTSSREQGLGDAFLALTKSFLQPVSEERVFVDATEFDKLTPPNIYHWKTHLRFVRLFRRQNANVPKFLENLTGFDEKIRIAKFDVLWKATVDDNVDFSDESVTDIQFVEQTQEEAWLNKVKYGFEEPLASKLGT
jgi:hypothetical protein